MSWIRCKIVYLFFSLSLSLALSISLSLLLSLSILSMAEADKFATFATSKSFSDVLNYDLDEASYVQIQETPSGDYLFFKCSAPVSDYFVCHPRDSLQVVNDQLDTFGYAIAKKATTSDNIIMYQIYPTGLEGVAQPTYAPAPDPTSLIYARSMQNYYAPPTVSGSPYYGNYWGQPQLSWPVVAQPAPSTYNSFTPGYNPYLGNYWGQMTSGSPMGSGSVLPPSLMLDISSTYNQPVASPYPTMSGPLLSPVNYRYPLSYGGFPLTSVLLPSVL